MSTTRFRRCLLCVAAVGVATAGAAGCGDLKQTGTTASAPNAAPLADGSTAQASGSEAAPAAAKSPRSLVLAGRGAKVVRVTLRADSPLVVTASNAGSSNFVVKLLAPGTEELLYNEIGPYKGQAIWAEAARGRYKVSVDAEGAWKLRLVQPVPTAGASTLPGNLAGRGSVVVPVRVGDDLQPTVTAVNKGDSNFVVQLVGYATTSGSELVFNEIGPYKGETVIDDLPSGDYLLSVTAVGPWTLRFTA